jgi:hypothetical protein
MLVVGSLMITPALGSMYQAGHPIEITSKNQDVITVDFVDCTGITPVKKEITLPKTEWTSINTELQAITTSGTSMKETFTAQLTVLKNHQLIPQNINADTLLNQYNQRTTTEKIRTLQNKIHFAPIFNNSLFGVLCAITFTMNNGTNIVLGLNTFVNYIGFDILSIHNGYAPNGLQANGLISDSVPPGHYAGFMFGFFGYWFGTKSTTFAYSDVTVAGLTFITIWIPS